MAALVAEAALLAAPVDEDAGREFGRGKRMRSEASYTDLGEREFNRLCRWVAHTVACSHFVVLNCPTGHAFAEPHCRTQAMQPSDAHLLPAHDLQGGG